jgi:hypothetical protein
MEMAIIDILQGLPERWRSVFLLCVVDELTQTEVAQLLGLNRRVVNLYMSYVRFEIATRLKMQGFEPPAWLGQASIWTGVDDVPDIASSSFLPLMRAQIRVTFRYIPDQYTPDIPFSSIQIIRIPIRPAKSSRRRRPKETN